MSLTQKEKKEDIDTYAADCVQKWGSSASIAMFDQSCKVFTAENIEGIIAYRVEYGCAVVFGNPICAKEKIPELAQAFHKFCESQKWHAIYAIASEEFAHWALENGCHALLEFGEELYVDPGFDPTEGAKARKLRNKLSCAVRSEIEIHEYSDNDEGMQKKIEQVGAAWVKGRRGPQIYLANVQLFKQTIGKRWFYAQEGEKDVVGVLLLNRLAAYKGWLCNLVLTTPKAPTGTSELLVIKTIEALRAEGCPFLSFGAVVGKDLGEIVGFNRLFSWLARRAFRLVKKIFHLDARRVYWNKFLPQGARSYIIFSTPKITLRDMFGIMRALNVIHRRKKTPLREKVGRVWLI